MTINVVVHIPFSCKRAGNSHSLLRLLVGNVMYMYEISEPSVNKLTVDLALVTHSPPQFIHPPFLSSLGYGTKTYKRRMDCRGTILIQNFIKMTRMILGIKC
jgi:hypothetical protein